MLIFGSGWSWSNAGHGFWTTNWLNYRTNSSWSLSVDVERSHISIMTDKSPPMVQIPIQPVVEIQSSPESAKNKETELDDSETTESYSGNTPEVPPRRLPPSLPSTNESIESNPPPLHKIPSKAWSAMGFQSIKINKKDFLDKKGKLQLFQYFLFKKDRKYRFSFISRHFKNCKRDKNVVLIRSWSRYFTCSS